MKQQKLEQHIEQITETQVDIYENGYGCVTRAHVERSIPDVRMDSFINTRQLLLVRRSTDVAFLKRKNKNIHDLRRNHLASG